MLISCIASIILAFLSLSRYHFGNLDYFLILNSPISIFLLLLNTEISKYRNRFKIVPITISLILLVIYIYSAYINSPLYSRTFYPIQIEISITIISYSILFIVGSFLFIFGSLTDALLFRKSSRYLYLLIYIFLTIGIILVFKPFIYIEDNSDAIAFIVAATFIVAAISTFLTLIHLLASKRRFMLKAILSFVSRASFSLALSIILLIVPGLINRSYIYDSEVGSIAVLVSLYLALLQTIIPPGRSSFKSILTAASYIAFIVYILSVLHDEITELFFLIKIGFWKITGEKIADYAIYNLFVLLIIIAIICIYLYLVTFVIPKKALFVRNFFIVLSTIFCVVCIGIAFYINMIAPFTYRTGLGSGGSESDLIIYHLEFVSKPKGLQEIQVNQPYKLSIQIMPQNGKVSLTSLEGNITGSILPLPRLLGEHNSYCISASLIVDPKMFDVNPSQVREYPLNQQSITWNWIITPKQPGKQQIINTDFEVIGAHSCNGEKNETVEGPYLLSGSPNFTFTVINPNDNIIAIIANAFRSIDPGVAINAALGTLLVSLVTWMCSGLLKRITTKSITLSGHIYDPFGNPLPNQQVSLLIPGTGQVTAQAATVSSGSYSLQVNSGTYQLEIESIDANNNSLDAPQFYDLFVLSYSMNQSAIADFTLPARKVSIHVQDAGNNPVSNVEIKTQPNSILNNNLSIGRGLTAQAKSGYGVVVPGLTTDSSGNVTLWLFPNDPNVATYSFVATPLSGSIYATVTLSNITVKSDQSEIISLQFVHDHPVTTATLSPTPNGQGQYPIPVMVTLQATAASGFTITSTKYMIDGGSTQTYTAPFTVSGAGSHTITYWSIDNILVFELPNTKTFTLVSKRRYLFGNRIIYRS